MPEPHACFVCGKPHERSSRVCAQCAVAYGPDRPFAPLPELCATAETPMPATERPERSQAENSARVPDWDDDIFAPQSVPPPAQAPRGIPLPPQLQPNPSGVSTESPVSETESDTETVRCGECDKPAEPDFSFCTGCGADLPGAIGAANQNVNANQNANSNQNPLSSNPERPRENEPEPGDEFSETVSRGIRDTRARVRRIAEAYDNAVEAAGNEIRGGQRQMQRPSGDDQETEPGEATATKPVSPLAHGVLSFFFPGVGQILNGQPGKGFLLIVAGFVSVMAWGLGPWAIPIVVIRMLVALDAYRIANRRLAGDAIDPNEWDLT